ncbi:MAG: hypothetical protein CMJ78_02405 [Planctomycetaceae bacterium]|nr:hypothetical protein [Planctomycetaceae bacterium]
MQRPRKESNHEEMRTIRALQSELLFVKLLLQIFCPKVADRARNARLFWIYRVGCRIDAQDRQQSIICRGTLGHARCE